MNRLSPAVDSIRQSVLAIDGHSLLYRAYFALPESIRDQRGRPVNAVHGFVSMLARLLREHQPNGVLVAYDSPWPTIRHASFPGYKANRGALPDTLLAQVPIAQELLRRMGIPTLAVAGYEGDDILASLADHCSLHHSLILIVTGDRDLFQLVRDPWVRVLYTRRGVSGEQILDEEGVKRLVGVEPSRYADLAALRGDVSDNIAGIAGIGEKTALTIIGLTSSFKELCERPERLPAGLASKLANQWDIVLRNRELMRHLSDVPVNWDHLSLSWRIDQAEAQAALNELGLIKTYELLVDCIDHF